MDYPLRVFISHKVEDQGSVAAKFVDLLKLYGDQDKLEFFISSRIEAGREWKQEIHQQLRNSNLLILLYLSPTAEINWCLYETGFFAAAAKNDTEKRLFCIVPAGDKAPGPLQGWQNIELNHKGIKHLLKAIFKNEQLPVKPQLFEEDNSNNLNKLIDDTLKVLGSAEDIHYLSNRVWITIPTSSDDKYNQQLIASLKEGILPEKTMIAGDSEAFRQFGIDSRTGIEFSELSERMEFGEAIPLFQPILTKAMADILNKKAGTYPLPPLRVVNSGPARSLVFTCLTERPNGDLVFRFVVSEPQPTATFGKDDPFSTLYRLLAISLHFRSRVINQHLSALEFKIHDDDQSEKFKDDVYNILKEIDFDINNVMLDSMNRGLKSRGQIVKAFEGSEEDINALLSIMNPTHGQWIKAFEKFKTSLGTRNLAQAIEALQVMKETNRTIISITSKRLAYLAEKMT